MSELRLDPQRKYVIIHISRDASVGKSLYLSVMYFEADQVNENFRTYFTTPYVGYSRLKGLGA